MQNLYQNKGVAVTLLFGGCSALSLLFFFFFLFCALSGALPRRRPGRDGQVSCPANLVFRLVSLYVRGLGVCDKRRGEPGGKRASIGRVSRSD